MSIFENSDFDDHEGVHYVSDAQSGLRAIIAIHSCALGPALGGLRMFDYECDDDALSDVLRLSRGMTYKNALAGIPYGGGKAVIIGDPQRKKSPSLLQAMARGIDRLGGNYVTAEDVGTTVSDMDILREETPFARGTSIGAGDPSPYTAKGVYLAIKEAISFKFGAETLSGVQVAVQGLGNVGANLCTLLHDDGAELLVTDIDPERIQRMTQRFGAIGVSPDSITSTDVDVFAPCAMGAVVNQRTATQLKASIVCGAANNQLSARTLATKLNERGILYVPDFVANAGGVINIALEDQRTADEISERVDLIAETTREILCRAIEDRLPIDVAEELARERIEQALGAQLAA